MSEDDGAGSAAGAPTSSRGRTASGRDGEPDTPGRSGRGSGAERSAGGSDEARGCVVPRSTGRGRGMRAGRSPSAVACEGGAVDAAGVGPSALSGGDDGAAAGKSVGGWVRSATDQKASSSSRGSTASSTRSPGSGSN